MINLSNISTLFHRYDTNRKTWSLKELISLRRTIEPSQHSPKQTINTEKPDRSWKDPRIHIGYFRKYHILAIFWYNISIFESELLGSLTTRFSWSELIWTRIIEKKLDERGESQTVPVFFEKNSILFVVKDLRHDFSAIINHSNRHRYSILILSRQIFLKDNPKSCL